MPLPATTLHVEGKKPQVPPLRFASVGMTILLCHRLLVPLTGAKANSHNRIVIPTGAYPDFLLPGTHPQPRMRLSLEKAALTPPTPPVSTGNPGEMVYIRDSGPTQDHVLGNFQPSLRDCSLAYA